jgi:DNA-binding response OmpR family regulator
MLSCGREDDMRILVVEDERKIAEALKKGLEAEGPWTLDHQMGGSKQWRQDRSREYDASR